jgi:hypothetical protein
LLLQQQVTVLLLAPAGATSWLLLQQQVTVLLLAPGGCLQLPVVAAAAGDATLAGCLQLYCVNALVAPRSEGQCLHTPQAEKGGYSQKMLVTNIRQHPHKASI